MHQVLFCIRHTVGTESLWLWQWYEYNTIYKKNYFKNDWWLVVGDILWSFFGRYWTLKALICISLSLSLSLSLHFWNHTLASMQTCDGDDGDSMKKSCRYWLPPFIFSRLHSYRTVLVWKHAHVLQHRFMTAPLIGIEKSLRSSNLHGFQVQMDRLVFPDSGETPMLNAKYFFCVRPQACEHISCIQLISIISKTKYIKKHPSRYWTQVA